MAAAASAPPEPLPLDLDGDGLQETVETLARRDKIRITARNARGKRIASAEAPAPADDNRAVTLQAGSLGSAGALLEVTASSSREECRSLWRLRGGKLQRLPLLSPEGTLPSCALAGAWTARFERQTEEAPAVYLRQRTAQSPRGLHRETQVFRFSGFALERQEVRGEIDDIPIPAWYDGLLYPRASIESLAELFDLDPVRSLPVLWINASPSAGKFELRFLLAGRTDELAVRSSQAGARGEVILRAEGNGRSATAKVSLARDVPYEVLVTGLGERYEHVYSPVSHLTAEGLQVFPNAEAQIAREVLPGNWTSEKGERLAIEAVPEAFGRVRIDAETFALDLVRAPAGTDLLLIGRDSVSALDLRGRNAFVRRTARCPDKPPESSTCFVTGPAGDVFRRIGARMNLR